MYNYMNLLDDWLGNVYGKNTFGNNNFILTKAFESNSSNPYINNWILMNGFNYENKSTLGTLGGMDALLRKGQHAEELEQARLDEYQEGYNEGRKGKGKGSLQDKLEKEQFRAAKFGFLVPHNLLLTNKGEMFAFTNFNKVGSNAQQLKGLSGTTDITPEIRKTIAEGLRPRKEFFKSVNLMDSINRHSIPLTD